VTAASERVPEPGTRLLEELRLLIEAVTERAGPWLDRVAGEHAGVIDRAADLVALLRAVLADRWEPGMPHMPGFRPEPRPASKPAPGPAPRVQKIPVRRKGNA
jgi:hypothetical protein